MQDEIAGRGRPFASSGAARVLVHGATEFVLAAASIALMLAVQPRKVKLNCLVYESRSTSAFFDLPPLAEAWPTSAATV